MDPDPNKPCPSGDTLTNLLELSETAEKKMKEARADVIRAQKLVKPLLDAETSAERTYMNITARIAIWRQHFRTPW